MNSEDLDGNNRHGPSLLVRRARDLYRVVLTMRAVGVECVFGGQTAHSPGTGGGVCRHLVPDDGGLNRRRPVQASERLDGARRVRN